MDMISVYYMVSDHLNLTDDLEVPSVAQWNWRPLGNAGTWVRSPAQHSGFSIWCCHSCSLGGSCSLNLIPGLGTPYATWWPKKKEERERERDYLNLIRLVMRL